VTPFIPCLNARTAAHPVCILIRETSERAPTWRRNPNKTPCATTQCSTNRIGGWLGQLVQHRAGLTIEPPRFICPSQPAQRPISNSNFVYQLWVEMIK